MESTIKNVYFNGFIGNGQSINDTSAPFSLCLNNGGNVYATLDTTTQTIYLYLNTGNIWTNVYNLTDANFNNMGIGISGDGNVAMFVSNPAGQAYVTYKNNLVISNLNLNLNTYIVNVSLNNTGSICALTGQLNNKFSTFKIIIDTICTICTIQSGIRGYYGFITRNSQYLIADDESVSNFSTLIYKNISPSFSTPYYSLYSYLDQTGYSNLGRTTSISEDGQYAVTANGISTSIFYKWNKTTNKYDKFDQIYTNLGSEVSMSRNGNYCYIGNKSLCTITVFKNSATGFISTMTITSSTRTSGGFGFNVKTNWDGSVAVANDMGTGATATGRSYVLNYGAQQPQPTILDAGAWDTPTPTEFNDISMNSDGTALVLTNYSTTGLQSYVKLYNFSNNTWNNKNLISSFAEPQTYPTNSALSNSISISGNGNVIAYANIFNDGGTTRYYIKSIRSSDNFNTFSSISTFSVIQRSEPANLTYISLNYTGNILVSIDDINEATTYKYNIETNRWDLINNMTVISATNGNNYIKMSKSPMYPNGNYIMINNSNLCSTFILTNGGVESANYSLVRGYGVGSTTLYPNMTQSGDISDDANYIILGSAFDTNNTRDQFVLFLYWDSVNSKYSLCQTPSTIGTVRGNGFGASIKMNFDGSIAYISEPASKNVYMYQRVATFANAVWTKIKTITYGSNYFGYGVTCDMTGQIMAAVNCPFGVSPAINGQTLVFNNNVTYSTFTNTKTSVTTLSSASLYLVQSAAVSSFQINQQFDGEMYTIKDDLARYISSQLSYQPGGSATIDNGRASNISQNQPGAALSFMFNQDTNSSYLLNAGYVFRDAGCALVSTLGPVTPTFVSSPFITINTVAASAKIIAIPPGLPNGSFFTIKDIAGGGAGFILAGNQGTTIEGLSTSYVFPKNYTSVILSLNNNNLSFLSVNDFSFLTGHPAVSPSAYSPSFITGTLAAGVNLVDSASTTKTFNLPVVSDGNMIIVKDIGGGCLNNTITVQAPDGALSIDDQYSGVAIYKPYAALWLMTAGGKYWITNVVL